MTTPIDPNYRHPKCYANLHGGCSTKISGEHYISHSLIKLYTFNDPDVRVKRNSGFGIRHDVRPKNFVVNALCTNHNSALGVTDKAALEFATFVRSIAIGFGAALASGARRMQSQFRATISNAGRSNC